MKILQKKSIIYIYFVLNVLFKINNNKKSKETAG